MSSTWLASLGQQNISGILLRGASMGGKFLLILFLTKTSSLETVGVYGLFVTSVTLVNYLQGMAFFTYSEREILAVNQDERNRLIFNQMVFYLGVYAMLFPATLVIFYSGLISFELICYFYAILVVTHLGQELHRLLILFLATTRAYVVSFFVQGAWAIVAILVLLVFPGNALQVVFLCWGVSAFVGLLIGVLSLRKLGYLRQSTWKDLEVGWIVRGVKTCWRFLLAISAYKVVEFSDRYFLNIYHGDLSVGVYTLYSRFANLAQEIVYVCVIAIVFPKMLAAFKQSDMLGYKRHLDKLKHSLVRYSIVSTIASALIFIAVLSFLDKEELVVNLAAFWLLLIASLLVCLSQVYYYALYAWGRDREIMWQMVLAMCVNIVLNILLVPGLGVHGAALASLVSFSLLLVIRYQSAVKLNVLINDNEK
ncbi:MAG: polysaccharide biosynthesis C-terminal domain-containing protein [Pseudomonadota bacterium]